MKKLTNNFSECYLIPIDTKFDLKFKIKENKKS